MRRLVVKVGSGLLAGWGTRLDRGVAVDVVGQLCELADADTQVVLVSSGAVALGCERLGLDQRPADIPTVQAAAALLARRLQEGGAEVLHAVRFNQALVAFGDDACTAATAAAIQRDGRCWAAAAPYHGRVVLRLSVSSWRTSEADIEEAARAILECAAAVSAAQQAVTAADS